jgi:cytochrome P450
MKPNQYADDLKRVGYVSGLRLAFPTLFPILARFPIPLFREAHTALNRLDTYAAESIQRYRHIVAVDPVNPKPTLFTKVFQDKSLSQEELVVEARGYIVAGSDTTANSLTFLTWAVCRNEAVKKMLVEEVAGLPNGYVDEDLKKLPYLGQVIEETLRLYAAAPGGLPREVPKGGCEVDGYWIPGQTTVTTQAYSMHRDPVLFPQPERYSMPL